jgi:hypothetical protein
MKLRVSGIDDTDTPRELRTYFEQFGTVEAVAIYAGEDLSYAVIEMPESDADNVIHARRPIWKEKSYLDVRIANRYRGRWVFATWRPPTQHCR